MPPFVSLFFFFLFFFLQRIPGLRFPHAIIAAPTDAGYQCGSGRQSFQSVTRARSGVVPRLESQSYLWLPWAELPLADVKAQPALTVGFAKALHGSLTVFQMARKCSLCQTKTKIKYHSQRVLCMAQLLDFSLHIAQCCSDGHVHLGW